MASDEVLTRKEVAEMLRLPMATLDYYVSTKQIPFSRLGKRNIRFVRRRIIEWLTERENVEYRMKGGK